MASFARVPEIYSELLDLMVSQPNTSSPIAATRTGPFTEFREAFLFAASLGYALNSEEQSNRSGQKNGKTIKDDIFLRGDGAKEVVSAIALTSGTDGLDILERTEQAQERRFARVNALAEAGFEYLANAQKALPQATIGEILIYALQHVDPTTDSDRTTQDSDLVDPILALIAGRTGGTSLKPAD